MPPALSLLRLHPCQSLHCCLSPPCGVTEVLLRLPGPFQCVTSGATSLRLCQRPNIGVPAVLSRPQMAPGLSGSPPRSSVALVWALPAPARPRALFFQPSPTAQSQPCLRHCSCHHPTPLQMSRGLAAPRLRFGGPWGVSVRAQWWRVLGEENRRALPTGGARVSCTLSEVSAALRTKTRKPQTEI